MFPHCDIDGLPATLPLASKAVNNANDAKTFLKHFSDCLFYFWSTCTDCLTDTDACCYDDVTQQNDKCNYRVVKGEVLS